MAQLGRGNQEISSDLVFPVWFWVGSFCLPVSLACLMVVSDEVPLKDFAVCGWRGWRGAGRYFCQRI